MIMYIAEKDMGWFCVLRIGVSDLHHGDRPVGMDPGDTVGTADDGVAAENVGPAVLAAEDGPLGEHCKTVKRRGMDGTGDGIGQNLIVEGHINAIMVPVEGHRLHINIGIKQFGAADSGTGGRIQHTLGTAS